MVIKNSDMPVSLRHELRGGKGDIKFTEVLPKEMLSDKGRLFSIMTVEPGCSVGAHDHTGEAEIYFVLKGKLQGDDNGTPVVLEPGDVMYTGGGAYHAVENLEDEPAEVLAVILFD